MFTFGRNTVDFPITFTVFCVNTKNRIKKKKQKQEKKQKTETGKEKDRGTSQFGQMDASWNGSVRGSNHSAQTTVLKRLFETLKSLRTNIRTNIRTDLLIEKRGRI